MRHISFILFTLFWLLTASGCISNEEPVDKKAYVDFNVKIMTRGNGDNGPGDELNLSSVRILLFDKLGNCALNRKCTNTEFNRTTDSDGNTIITLIHSLSFTSQIIRDEFDVYAVLNDENGFYSSTVDGQKLSDGLDACSEGTHCLLTFRALLQTPLTYSSLTGLMPEEPPFVMCAHQERVTIPDGTTPGKPYTINLSESEDDYTDRSMAIIYIDKITSDNGDEDVPGIPDGDGKETPGDRAFTSRIFVTKAELINVPAQYVWNAEDNRREEGNAPLSETFLNISTDDKGYINDADLIRHWSGTLWQKFNCKLVQASTCDSTYGAWRMGGNGKQAWMVGKHEVEVKENDLATYQSLDKIAGEDGAREYRTKGQKGSFVNDLIDLILNGITEQGPYSDKSSEIEELTKEEALVSNTAWSLPIEKGWYVPENISTSKETATAIRIRLLIAKPEIKLDGEDIGDNWMKYVDWEPGGSQDTGGNGWNYYCGDDSLSKYTPKDGPYKGMLYDDIATNVVPEDDAKGLKQGGDVFLDKFAKICRHADIEQYMPNTGPNNTKDAPYHIVIGGLSARRRGGLADHEFVTNGSDADVKAYWQIPQGSIPVEFIIPINNADFDGDYSVRRNYRYNVTLTVNKNTYDILSKLDLSNGPSPTKSSANASPIKVSVERIKRSEP